MHSAISDLQSETQCDGWPLQVGHCQAVAGRRLPVFLDRQGVINQNCYVTTSREQRSTPSHTIVERVDFCAGLLYRVALRHL